MPMDQAWLRQKPTSVGPHGDHLVGHEADIDFILLFQPDRAFYVPFCLARS